MCKVAFCFSDISRVHLHPVAVLNRVAPIVRTDMVLNSAIAIHLTDEEVRGTIELWLRDGAPVHSSEAEVLLPERSKKL